MANNGITKYAEKYLEEKFDHLGAEIKEVKTDVKEIKVELKKNGKCLHEITSTMKVYKSRVRHLFFLVGIIFVLVVLGFATGLEVFTKGVLGFLK